MVVDLINPANVSDVHFEPLAVDLYCTSHAAGLVAAVQFNRSLVKVIFVVDKLLAFWQVPLHPSSTCPSQLLSIPSQISGAPGKKLFSFWLLFYFLILVH